MLFIIIWWITLIELIREKIFMGKKLRNKEDVKAIKY